VRLGVQFNRFDGAAVGALGSVVADSARRAEAAGFSSLWVMDHFFQIPILGSVDDPMVEAYATLSYAAAATERIKLGALVSGVMYRHPAVLVKMVTTLDVLSAGRAYFGIGAAWFEREHRGLGVPFPPTAERFERLEETLRIAHQMWAGGAAPFAGKHNQLAEARCRPLPVSRPHPPILIGGSGERKTLRLVARYGDACNLYAFDFDLLRHKLGVLRDHCDAEGRPNAAIEKTTISGLPKVTRDGANGTVTPEQALEFLAQLAEMGIDQHVLGMSAVGDAATMALIGERVVPEAAKLVPAGRTVET
jgi:F420-dependent oxidoreductase-like protein